LPKSVGAMKSYYNNLKISLCSQLVTMTFQGVSMLCCFVFWFF
jgi:hypothetical protein